MAFLEILNLIGRQMPSAILGPFLTGTLTSLILFTIHRAFSGPLRKIPGPLQCRISSLWTLYHSYIGDECTRITELHDRYGPVVIIGPNEVSISDGAALAPVYSEKGGFLKDPCYSNFDIEGHSTIFSALDPAHRAVRSKAVVPMFSMGNVRAGSEKIEACLTKMLRRFKDEIAESRKARKDGGAARPVNVLNLGRSLALDAVSSYLFGKDFGGVDEQELSASVYVDALVAVGRLFFLPNWIFLAIETTRMKYFPFEGEVQSAEKINSFVDPMVRDSSKDDSTYQGRLLKAGVSPHEVEVQCKDLMFAGTDSTGNNISTLCWHLAKQPAVYQKLRQEIQEADAKDPTYNPQTLPYLDAVVREGLRISMANPTRLPRIVPPQGFNFVASNGETYFLPPGTQVGIQIYTLHFNANVFPDPYAFKPERWLDASPEMQRDWIPFGLGQRQCIARNLATMELFLAIRAFAREDILAGAQAVGESIELKQWFNSKVVGEKIELVWD
ncbi:cytochrome P450 oxidoreductase [Hortaea werneckii]|nr:cytochrome P450 oxidoreductase [Hortaea werneckii]